MQYSNNTSCNLLLTSSKIRCYSTRDAKVFSTALNNKLL
ncbi:MAG: hypothetical protein AVDCRST_MAG96-495 [uncultured Segetibacter sp.]|uniref:Uncharacterized protein n=1 Tax=uncultured Segetibacter sp. TaxID=481133 RepID=A0A6J4RLT8_9BACT|nr:MAG: hypothetical protein AVDCRST_MAG96-495 [uncultured Segetibacter sp.]